MKELVIEGDNKKLLGFDVPDELRISYHDGYFHFVVREEDEAAYVKLTSKQALEIGQWLINQAKEKEE